MRLKRSKFTTKLIVFALILYAAAALISLQAQSEDVVEVNDDLEKKVAEMEIDNANYEYAIENHDNPDVIADIARLYLGLALPGEVVIYDDPAEQGEGGN